MANRRPQAGGRRMDFIRNDHNKNFRSTVSPWQGGGPGNPNILPLAGDATLALVASNLINLLQPRHNAVPSLLDMPMRRDFRPNVGRYDRTYGPNRMGNQGYFRRTGNYNRDGERINTNSKPFRPNEGPKQQYKSQNEANSKAKIVKDSEEDTDQEKNTSENNEGEKKDAPKTRYDDINSQFLVCHICNKSMWDGRSFENHLGGRAHAIMMQKAAESYALTADTMRQELKIREMKHTRKTGQQPQCDFYCAMCDIYAADGAIHRTTVGHRKLKKYLHPSCVSCHKEMPTRIELDEHRLTPEHLKVMQETQEVVTKPRPEVMMISTLDMEQMYVRDNGQRGRRLERNDKTEEIKEKKESEEDKDGEVEKEVEENKNENIEDSNQEEVDEKELKKAPTDNEKTILDYKEGDDFTVTKDMIPAYSTLRGVGESFLRDFRCVQCSLCQRLLDSDETAAVHIRTWRHHKLFVRVLRDKAGDQQPPDDEPTETKKRPLNCDDSGNRKRRKTSQGDDQDQDNLDMTEQLEDEGPKEDKVLGNGDNKTDASMSFTEELEDWEKSLDQILREETPNEENASESIEINAEEESVSEDYIAKDKNDKATTVQGKFASPRRAQTATPRAQGRGRRRV